MKKFTDNIKNKVMCFVSCFWNTLFVKLFVVYLNILEANEKSFNGSQNELTMIRRKDLDKHSESI